MWYTYTVEYYLARKKSEIMPFAATWMGLDIMKLNEVSQTERQIIYPLICGILKKRHKLTCLQNRNRLTYKRNLWLPKVIN